VAGPGVVHGWRTYGYRLLGRKRMGTMTGKICHSTATVVMKVACSSACPGLAYFENQTRTTSNHVSEHSDQLWLPTNRPRMQWWYLTPGYECTAWQWNDAGGWEMQPQTGWSILFTHLAIHSPLWTLLSSQRMVKMMISALNGIQTAGVRGDKIPSAILVKRARGALATVDESAAVI
jgi:hypothetical protein